MKPPKSSNNRPGKAFWLVLIIIGGTTVWQKATAPPKPLTDIKTSKNVPGPPSFELSTLTPGLYGH